MKRRILITGGFGYLGGRVAQHLQHAGHQTVLGSREAKNLPDWLPQAEVAKIDWQDERVLEQICAGIDVVIHAAGLNAQDCESEPVAALEFNGLATARLVASASHAGVKRFIYLSTAHVYASPLIGTITEETCPRNLHSYATSHLAGENTVLFARQRGEIEGIVLRLSNAFGAPAHKDVNTWMLLVNDLCRQAVQTRKLVLRSSGLQQRNFLTLADAGRAIEHLLALSKSDCGNGLFNLGENKALSVWDMVQKISHRCQLTLGYQPAIERPAPRPDELVNSLNYCSEKLQKTGFCLLGNLDDEIDRTLLVCAQIWKHNEA
ncbi:MAG: UDP-glucose 4-epimerase [Gallionellales bacterium GWA2_55_18]|nr:MAG: UDP-glucose 4-epimerase [Gallionellales bacterium GWA2_55_18]